MKLKNNLQSGMGHLILLIGILVVGILVVVGMVLYKPLMNQLSTIQYTDVPRSYTTETSQVATSSSDLEKELESETLTDPSEDFSDVDKDITSL